MWTIRIVVQAFAINVMFESLLAEGLIASKRPRTERSNEHRIKRVVLRNYDKTTRPVINDTAPVEVDVAISLYHILDTNEKEQTFTCLIAIRQRWRDEYLVWNKSAFGGVEYIRVPANIIWTPDLVISNFAGEKFNDYMITNTIIRSDGLVLWLYPALIKTYCTLNVKYFPFDTQHCKIVFISWTHSGHQLDVIYNESFPTSSYYNSDNQEWAVDNITAERHNEYYACCPEPYPDVTFTIHMRRGSLFYVVNLIAPCLLIFLISFLGFFLPVESGEKVNLETTILLALVVFLLMVGETMPPTPDCIPILGMFFASTMVMVSIALVMAVIVTNIYAKKDIPERCPDWSVRLAARFYPAHYLPGHNEHHHHHTAGVYCRYSGHNGPLPAIRERRPRDRLSTVESAAVGDVVACDGDDSTFCDCCGSLTRQSKCDVITDETSRAASSKTGSTRAGWGTVTSHAVNDGGRRCRRTEEELCPCCWGRLRHWCRHDQSHRCQYVITDVITDDRRRGSAAVAAAVPVSAVTLDSFDFRRSEAEWRMVAKFTDRVFFWMFLGLSLFTHCNLFLQMIPETRGEDG